MRKRAMPTRSRPNSTCIGLLAVVLVGSTLLAVFFCHVAVAQEARSDRVMPPPPSSTPKKHERIVVLRDMTKLPGPVAEMREAILDAVRRGSISDLRYAVELNELKPDFGKSTTSDVIASLKKKSDDGEGLAILALLANILEAPCAVVPIGPDVENAKLFVWPYLAEIAPDKLTPAEQVELYRLLDHRQVVALRTTRTWTWWRLAIGADGVWHSFVRAD